MRSHGWQVDYLYSPAIARVTVRLVKLLSLSEECCFCALWHETVVRVYNVYYALKESLCFTKNKLPCLLRVFYIVVTGIL
jgi:hypothetical protein